MIELKLAEIVMRYKLWVMINEVQLNPALLDFKGLTNLICYRQNPVPANIGNKELSSITGGIPLVAGPLEPGKRL